MILPESSSRKSIQAYGGRKGGLKPYSTGLKWEK